MFFGTNEVKTNEEIRMEKKLKKGKRRNNNDNHLI